MPLAVVRCSKTADQQESCYHTSGRHSPYYRADDALDEAVIAEIKQMNSLRYLFTTGIVPN